MKKQLLILMALFISIIGHSQTFTENFITYSVTSTNTVAVVDYNISGGTDVVIPASVTETSTSKTSSSKGENSLMATYDVTSIGYQAFFNKGITSVDIPNSIISIGTEAFYGNLLTSVVLPDGLTAINQSCFFNNQLTSITIPDSVLTIGTQAFSVNFITSAILGNSVTTIGINAFYNNNLTTITIPNSVTTIDFRAFDDNLLANVIIGNGVTTIGDHAFRDNPLTCVSSLATTPPTITTGANDSFGASRSNINLSIPSGTASAYATAQWTGFNSVTENSGNTFILDNITYVITSSNTVTATDYNTAGGTVVNILATVSRACNTYSVTSIGHAAFANNQLTNVTIPDSVINIGSDAFQNNDITILVIGNSVVSIDEGAFAFNDLPNVTIPNSVISIGDGAFAQNNNMQTCVLGSSVETIGEYAFRFNSIDNLTIPDSVISIGQLAFQDNQMTSLVLGNNLETIGDQVFNGANNITNIIIPASVTTMGVNVFGSGLTDVTSLSTTPPTIITGGADTFSGNRSNIHLHIPAGTMGAYVTDSGALWTGFNPVTEDALLSTSNLELTHDIKIISSTDKVEVKHSNSIELQGYSIYNMSGAKIKEGKENTISINTLSTGIYILELKFNEGRIAKKFVK
jgi:hypothetical protein